MGLSRGAAEAREVSLEVALQRLLKVALQPQNLPNSHRRLEVALQLQRCSEVALRHRSQC